MSFLINPVPWVLVPYESIGSRKVKRNDLPRFKSPEDAMTFMKRYPEIHLREGFAVKLDWIQHDEDWALAEYHRGVGSQGWQT